MANIAPKSGNAGTTQVTITPTTYLGNTDKIQTFRFQIDSSNYADLKITTKAADPFITQASVNEATVPAEGGRAEFRVQTNAKKFIIRLAGQYLITIDVVIQYRDVIVDQRKLTTNNEVNIDLHGVASSEPGIVSIIPVMPVNTSGVAFQSKLVVWANDKTITPPYQAKVIQEG